MKALPSHGPIALEKEGGSEARAGVLENDKSERMKGKEDLISLSGRKHEGLTFLGETSITISW